MDKATQSMIENLHKNTGQTLEQWTALVREQNFAKHGEIISFLKRAPAHPRLRQPDRPQSQRQRCRLRREPGRPGFKPIQRERAPETNL
jgi:hypothetical protein